MELLKMQACRRAAPFLVLFGFLGPLPSQAALQVNSLFSDGAVLQREIPVPVWGTASPGAKIEVEFAGQVVTSTTNDQGHWQVCLEPLAASSQGRRMLISGDGASIVIGDVVVGEVWVGSGQSNMALPMKEAEDGKAAMGTARDPMLRLFKRPATGRQPIRWVACTPEEVGDFSTVAYFFGKHLHEKLDVPVGLIVRAVGGTTIQRWVSPGSEQRNEVLAAFTAEAGRRRDELKRFESERDKYDRRNRPPPETARWITEMARLSYYQYPTGGLHRRWIRPLQPFAVRGVIWYQGEFNNRPGQAHDYRHWQPVLIDGWRKDWGQENLPFLFVQMQVLGNATTPLLRESQMKTLEQCSQTAMAVICDESAGLHPPSKRIAGDRLAMAALGLVYGAGFPPSGPMMKDMEIVDGKAVLTFEHVGRGLQCKTDVVRTARETSGVSFQLAMPPSPASGELTPRANRTAISRTVLTGFFMCGEDRKFRPAQARITAPEQLTVSCDEIETPAAVRYAWLCDPRSVMSLYNSTGLPASPFRTDAYVDVTPLDHLLPAAQPAKSPGKKGRANLRGKIKKIDGR